MNTYMIGYDLNKSGQDYQDLINSIKSNFGTWWHHLDSTWLVKTNMSAVQIRNLLTPHIDRNDELLVAALSGESAWLGFDEDGTNWLLRNIQPR